MKLYKDSGTNPFASCLPILLQMPIFFALFRLIDQAAKNGTAHGFMTEEQAEQFGNAKLFGKHPDLRLVHRLPRGSSRSRSWPPSWCWR